MLNPMKIKHYINLNFPLLDLMKKPKKTKKAKILLKPNNNYLPSSIIEKALVYPANANLRYSSWYTYKYPVLKKDFHSDGLIGVRGKFWHLLKAIERNDAIIMENFDIKQRTFFINLMKLHEKYKNFCLFHKKRTLASFKTKPHYLLRTTITKAFIFNYKMPFSEYIISNLENKPIESAKISFRSAETIFINFPLPFLSPRANLEVAKRVPVPFRFELDDPDLNKFKIKDWEYFYRAGYNDGSFLQPDLHKPLSDSHGILYWLGYRDASYNFSVTADWLKNIRYNLLTKAYSKAKITDFVSVDLYASIKGDENYLNYFIEKYRYP